MESSVQMLIGAPKHLQDNSKSVASDWTIVWTIFKCKLVDSQVCLTASTAAPTTHVLKSWNVWGQQKEFYVVWQLYPSGNEKERIVVFGRDQTHCNKTNVHQTEKTGFQASNMQGKT